MLLFGHVYSEKGMSPDPKKVEAIQNVAPPTNASEVRSLLSSAAFCSRFIKDFALITRPLRQLTCDGARWQWTQEEQLSFERLKSALSTKTTLGYFDPKKPTSIFVDGSPIGLGAVLTQEEESSKEVTPLHYASCPLTPTQTRYPKLIVKLFQFTGQSSVFTCLCMAKSSRSSLTISVFVQQPIFQTVCQERTLALGATTVSFHCRVSPRFLQPS